MNKAYVLAPREDWIVDRFVKEWSEFNGDMTTSNIKEADIVWLLADWCWSQLFQNGHLTNKKVLTTIHHIVPEKFGQQEQHEFRVRDLFTTAYHVYNERTKKLVESLTAKPVHLIPYWANQHIFFRTSDKRSLRKKHGLPLDRTLVGSFQRDTEGHDLVSPKLEKGPDILVDYIVELNRRQPVEVVLAGWRRQYVMRRLTDAGIKFYYFERPPHEVINELYQTLDLYPCSARYEGGPQSLIECGLLGVPVVTRPVGIAEQVLPSCAINDNLIDAVPVVPKVDSMLLPDAFDPYRRLLQEL